MHTVIICNEVMLKLHVYIMGYDIKGLLEQCVMVQSLGNAATYRPISRL